MKLSGNDETRSVYEEASIEFDERIKIETKKMKDGSYRSVVYANGEFYAAVRANDREATIQEANHYAAQLEFDEDGRW